MADHALRDRYVGRPFLRLLECYVMWAAGELPNELAEQLELLTPNLKTTYRAADGTWQQIVADQMEFSEAVPSELRAMWESAIAASEGSRVDMEAWARQVVDTNFA